MSFNPVDLWNTMTPLAKGVCVLLILMSIYSLTVAVERFIYYNKAKKQSLAFATLVTGYLKKDQLQEAIDSSKKFKNSHLARVVSAGLYEFTHDLTTGTADVPGHDPIEAAERAIEREALITTALGLFVAIPAVWLFNIFMNKIERFQVEMSNSASTLLDYFIKRRGAGIKIGARAS